MPGERKFRGKRTATCYKRGGGRSWNRLLHKEEKEVSAKNELSSIIFLLLLLPQQGFLFKSRNKRPLRENKHEKGCFIVGVKNGLLLFFWRKKKSSYFFDVSRRNAKEQYKSNILEKHPWSQIYRVDYRLKLLIKHTHITTTSKSDKRRNYHIMKHFGKGLSCSANMFKTNNYRATRFF